MIFPNANSIRSPFLFLSEKEPDLPKLWGKGGAPSRPHGLAGGAGGNPEANMDQAGLGEAAQSTALATPGFSHPRLTWNWLSLLGLTPPPAQASSDPRWERELEARQGKPSWAAARGGMCQEGERAGPQ